MSGVASLTAVANLPWVVYSVLQAFSAMTATATEFQLVPQPVHHNSRARAATSQAAFRYSPPVVADGKVDVFLDLACPDSAAAWATMKQVVWEYGFRTEFVFHILPTSQNQLVFDAAKALQIFQMYSTDSDDCALFIDVMLDHQNLIANEADDDAIRLEFFEEVLVKGAAAQGRVTEDQFKRGMEDPQVDHLVRAELESAALLGVYATPTVILNGIHMMRLIGADQLRNFELFVDRGMAPQPLYIIDGESVWASVEGGAIGEEGAVYEIRLSGLENRGELAQDKSMSATA